MNLQSAIQSIFINKVTAFALLTAMVTFVSCGSNNPTQSNQSVLKSIRNEEQSTYLLATPVANTDQGSNVFIKEKLPTVHTILKKLQDKETYWTVTEYTQDGTPLEQITENPISNGQLKKVIQPLSRIKTIASTSGYLPGAVLGLAIGGAILNSPVVLPSLATAVILPAGIIIGIVAGTYTSTKIALHSEGENFKSILPFNKEIENRVTAISTTETDMDFTQKKYTLVKKRLKKFGKAKTKSNTKSN